MASGMQEKQYSLSLLSFFIYNPKFGPREGEVSFTLFNKNILIIYLHWYFRNIYLASQLLMNE